MFTFNLMCDQFYIIMVHTSCLISLQLQVRHHLFLKMLQNQEGTWNYVNITSPIWNYYILSMISWSESSINRSSINMYQNKQTVSQRTRSISEPRKICVSYYSILIKYSFNNIYLYSVFHLTFKFNLSYINSVIL